MARPPGGERIDWRACRAKGNRGNGLVNGVDGRK